MKNNASVFISQRLDGCGTKAASLTLEILMNFNRCGNNVHASKRILDRVALLLVWSYIVTQLKQYYFRWKLTNEQGTMQIENSSQTLE